MFWIGRKQRKELETRIQKLEKSIDALSRERQKGVLSGLERKAEVGPFAERKEALLSYEELRRIYLQSATVRPAIDSIVRQVTLTPWKIKLKEGVEETDETKDELRKVEEFFEVPNRNREPLSRIFSKVLTDILVYDAGVIEKVKTVKGRLVEIFARDGSTVFPITDEHGILKGYEQRIRINGIEKKVKFAPDELVYLVLYPQSRSAYGLPIIESIVNEIASLLFSASFISKQFTEDEFPPGYLVLPEVDLESWERIRKEHETAAGATSKWKLKALVNVGRAEFLELKKPPRDLQLSELREALERIVFRNFGVTPVEMGFADRMPRATAEAQERLGRRKLYYPLISLLEYYLNTEIVAELSPNVKFQFEVPREEREILERARADALYVQWGIKTPDEVREGLGLGKQKIEKSEALEKAPEYVERTQPELIEELKERKTIPVQEIERLKKSYEEELQKVWEQGKKEVRQKLGKLIIQKAVAIGSPEKRAQIIETELDEIFREFQRKQREYFPQTYDEGQKRAAELIGKAAVATIETKKAVLRERYTWNERFLRHSLLADLRKDLVDVFEKEFEEEKELISKIEKGFDNKRHRVSRYGFALWGVAHLGFIRELEAQGVPRIRWVINSGNPCPDCLAFSGSHRIDALPAVPGDGTTRCDGNCYCTLELEV